MDATTARGASSSGRHTTSSSSAINAPSRPSTHASANEASMGATGGGTTITARGAIQSSSGRVLYATIPALAPIEEGPVRRTGVLMTHSMVMERLGYRADYTQPGTGAATGIAQRTLGSVGYTSESSVKLQAAVPDRTRQRVAKYAGRRPTQQDREYVAAYDAKGEQAFVAWKQKTDTTYMPPATKKRQQLEKLERFLEKDQEVRAAAEQQYHEWLAAKQVQQRRQRQWLQAVDHRNMERQQQRRAKDERYGAQLPDRQARFDLRVPAATQPTSFDDFHHQASQGGSGGHGSAVGADGSTAPSSPQGRRQAQGQQQGAPHSSAGLGVEGVLRQTHPPRSARAPELPPITHAGHPYQSHQQPHHSQPQDEGHRHGTQGRHKLSHLPQGRRQTSESFRSADAMARAIQMYGWPGQAPMGAAVEAIKAKYQQQQHPDAAASSMLDQGEAGDEGTSATHATRGAHYASEAHRLEVAEDVFQNTANSSLMRAYATPAHDPAGAVDAAAVHTPSSAGVSPQADEESYHGAGDGASQGAVRQSFPGEASSQIRVGAVEGEASLATVHEEEDDGGDFAPGPQPAVPTMRLAGGSHGGEGEVAEDGAAEEEVAPEVVADDDVAATLAMEPAEDSHEGAQDADEEVLVEDDEAGSDDGRRHTALEAAAEAEEEEEEPAGTSSRGAPSARSSHADSPSGAFVAQGSTVVDEVEEVVEEDDGASGPNHQPPAVSGSDGGSASRHVSGGGAALDTAAPAAVQAEASAGASVGHISAETSEAYASFSAALI